MKVILGVFLHVPYNQNFAKLKKNLDENETVEVAGALGVGVGVVLDQTDLWI